MNISASAIVSLLKYAKKIIKYSPFQHTLLIQIFLWTSMWTSVLLTPLIILEDFGLQGLIGLWHFIPQVGSSIASSSIKERQSIGCYYGVLTTSIHDEFLFLYKQGMDTDGCTVEINSGQKPFVTTHNFDEFSFEKRKINKNNMDRYFIPGVGSDPKAQILYFAFKENASKPASARSSDQAQGSGLDSESRVRIFPGRRAREEGEVRNFEKGHRVKGYLLDEDWKNLKPQGLMLLSRLDYENERSDFLIYTLVFLIVIVLSEMLRRVMTKIRQDKKSNNLTQSAKSVDRIRPFE